jgi:stage II sporulation protein P
VNRFLTVFSIVFLIFASKYIYDQREELPYKEKIYETALKIATEIYSPYIMYTYKDYNSRSYMEIMLMELGDHIPVAKAITYSPKTDEIIASDELLQMAKEENLTYKQNNDKETVSENEVTDEAVDETTNEAVNEVRNEAIDEASDEASIAANDEDCIFVPASAPSVTYSRQQLTSPSFIKSTFYSEDATTYIKEEQLEYDTLMGYDATLKQDSDNVQILLYHTHSQETYADSLPNDEETSIVGVGEHLSQILRNRYGYNVLHHYGEYDIESRDYAYSKALEGISKVLEENPSIEVIIDLHRDETNADTKLVTTIQNKPMAKFMFFNGLCYTRELGSLENLPNPYIQDNLSFAFQLQLLADEYYPGITRRIYLKGYRYNMHFRPKSLLIELGSQTNTVEEAMNSCEPIAHIISMVLSGENKE